jgi:hypothetical protein
MSPVKTQLVGIIDYMPDEELSLLLEIARRFIPDDIATPEDLEAIRIADEEYVRGEYVEEDAINWK